MPRWMLIVFAIIVAVAIWHEVSSDLESEDDGRITPVTLEQRRISDMEGAASVLARARAEEAFTSARATCSDPASSACDGSAREAAYEAARRTLKDGGCLTWEMSAWDPRAMRERTRAPTQDQAEAACLQQARDLADTITGDAARSGAPP
jgi:hypothetical protein